MIDYHVIRSKRQFQSLVEQLNKRRLPFKVAIQDIYPKRSLDLNDYLWGFIYSPIAHHTGHTPEEVHEYYKRLFTIGCLMVMLDFSDKYGKEVSYEKV